MINQDIVRNGSIAIVFALSAYVGQQASADTITHSHEHTHHDHDHTHEPEPVVVAPTPKPPTIINAKRSSVAKLPSMLEGAFKYNVNGLSTLTTYTHPTRGRVQLVMYWNDKRRAQIAERDFPHGKWSQAIDVHDAIGGEPLENDSHNNTAVGVDPKGFIWITGNHHVDPLRVAKTTRPYDLSTFVNIPRSFFGSADTDRVTYPEFFYTEHGDLALSYREQEVSPPRFRWLIKVYDAEKKRWSTMATINRGEWIRLYVSNIALDPNTGRIHFAGLWRDERNGGGLAKQKDLFHVYSDDEGKTWEQHGHKGPVRMPFFWNHRTQASDVPVNIWDTPPDPVPFNTALVVSDNRSRSHIGMLDVQRRVYHHWYNGSEWLSKRMQFKQSSGGVEPVAVGDGVGFIVSNGDEVRYHPADTNHPKHRAGVLLAKGATRSTSRVSSDRSVRKDGYLSILLTEAYAHKTVSLSANVEPKPRPGWVMTIPFDDLESFSTPFRAGKSTPATRPTTRPAATGACVAGGATLAVAKRAYSTTCSAPRVDCDKIGSEWVCSSARID